MQIYNFIRYKSQKQPIFIVLLDITNEKLYQTNGLKLFCQCLNTILNPIELRLLKIHGYKNNFKITIAPLVNL